LRDPPPARCPDARRIEETSHRVREVGPRPERDALLASQPQHGRREHLADLPRLFGRRPERVAHTAGSRGLHREEQPAGRLGFHQQRHEHGGDVRRHPAARAATRLSRSMLATAAASASSGAAPSLAAVVITPVPSGLERNTRSPARRPPLISTRSGWTRPVTQRPYFGSLSTTVWPPAMTPPASATFSAPPRKTSAMIALSMSRGKPATASANITSPPIA